MCLPHTGVNPEKERASRRVKLFMNITSLRLDLFSIFQTDAKVGILGHTRKHSFLKFKSNYKIYIRFFRQV
jgi:hypothetical protein